MRFEFTLREVKDLRKPKSAYPTEVGGNNSLVKYLWLAKHSGCVEKHECDDQAGKEEAAVFRNLSIQDPCLTCGFLAG